VVPAKFRLFLVDRRSPNAVSEISWGALAEGTAAVVSGAAARVASREAKEVGMFNHIGLKVKDIDASVHFYTASLTPLGYEITSQDETVAAFRHADGSSLWLYADARLAHSLLHIAFSALERGAVDAFHRQGLRARGRDNGAPGVRQDYSPDYYAAFLFDPDGNNIEAVCLKS
jgi:catechol 2,3-dioxygenase-like lactoylglutathione lyase family enzyme